MGTGNQACLLLTTEPSLPPQGKHLNKAFDVGEVKDMEEEATQVYIQNWDQN